jgi:hypothetical protein
MKSAHEPPTSSEVDLRRARWLSCRWNMSYQGNEYLNADGYNVVIFPWYDGWRNAITSIPNGVTIFSKYMYPTADAAKRAASVEIFVPEETATAMTIPEHNPPRDMSEVEQALFGRARRWAVATDLYRWDRGYQAHLALEFFEDFLPYEVPGTIQEVMTQIRLHVVLHLLHRGSLLRGRCLMCDPPPGVSDQHCSRRWRWATDWTKRFPCVLEELKKFILAGDQRRAEIDRLAAADGG